MVARQRKNDPTPEIQPFNSQDKEWIPSVHDKHLDVHEVYTNMVLPHFIFYDIEFIRD